MNPFEINTEEYNQFEMIMAVQAEVDTMIRNKCYKDPIGQAMIAGKEAERDLMLENIGE